MFVSLHQPVTKNLKPNAKFILFLSQFIKRREFELQQQQKMEGNLVFYIWLSVTLAKTIKSE
jgi:hypothetical protein